jgi:hypothetical protein
MSFTSDDSAVRHDFGWSSQHTGYDGAMGGDAGVKSVNSLTDCYAYRRRNVGDDQCDWGSGCPAAGPTSGLPLC